MYCGILEIKSNVVRRSDFWTLVHLLLWVFYLTILENCFIIFPMSLAFCKLCTACAVWCLYLEQIKFKKFYLRFLLTVFMLCKTVVQIWIQLSTSGNILSVLFFDTFICAYLHKKFNCLSHVRLFLHRQYFVFTTQFSLLCLFKYELR